MKIHDINPSQETVIVVIHPMLSDAAGMQSSLVEHLGHRYRAVIPDLSGHGEAIGQTYYSAKKEAEVIHTYLVEQNITHLKLGYGASLGGVVLFHLLHYTDLSFDHLFFESTSFYTDAKILEAVLKKVFLKKHNKAISDPAYSKKKMMAMFGEKAAGEMVNNFIHINEESLINIVHDCTNVKFRKRQIAMWY